MLDAIAFHAVVPFAASLALAPIVKFEDRSKLWGTMRSLANALSIIALVQLSAPSDVGLRFALTYVFLDSSVHLATHGLPFLTSFNCVHHLVMGLLVAVGIYKEAGHTLIDAFLMMEASTLVLGARRLLSLLGKSGSLPHTVARIVFPLVFVYYRLYTVYAHLQFVTRQDMFQQLPRWQQVWAPALVCVQLVFAGPVIYDGALAWLALTCGTRTHHILGHSTKRGM